MFNIHKINLTTGIKSSLYFKEFIFPAGEVSVKLNAADYAYQSIEQPNVIVARIQNSDDLFKLANLKDALERFDKNPINLFMPYLPYARQDRVCDRGESFSLKVFANYINSLNFNKVTIVDPHSLVSEAVIDRVQIISQLDVLNKYTDFIPTLMGSVLVSPDAGSNKKTAEVAGWLAHDNFVRADKLRDLTNGKIKEIAVYCDDLKGRNVVIVDDICEMGGTFIGLAAELKKKNCGKVILYVTHGVFGGDTNLTTTLEKLLCNGIDQIWTTDSYYHDLVDTQHPNIHVLGLVNKFFDKL